jgi:hypothetical protein
LVGVTSEEPARFNNTALLIETLANDGALDLHAHFSQQESALDQFMDSPSCRRSAMSSFDQFFD